MKMSFMKITLLLMVMFVLGCATTPLKKGIQQTEQQDYETAITTFELLLEEDKADSAKVMTELGITYFKMKEMNQAFPLLLKSFLKDTSNTRTLFYLALIYEMQDKYPYALDMYKRYHELAKSKSQKKRIQGRMLAITHKKLQKEIKATLAQESKLITSNLKDNSIAVFYFINTGKNEKLNPLQKGLADMLITDLSKVNQLNVVERVRMQALMDEMKLSMSGLTETKTSPRIGKLLGASKIIRGTYLDIGDKKFRMDAGLLNIKKVKSIKTTSVQGEFLKIFELEKKLVFKVIDEMNIKLSQAERDAIKIIPTENLLAFMAYSEGLDYEDKGMFDKATEFYHQAIQRDPNFKHAQQNLTKVQNISAASSDIAEFETLVIKNVEIETSTKEESTMAEKPSASSDEDLTSHMIHVGEVMTQTFLPGVESREAVQEQNTSSFGGGTIIQLVIPIPQDARR